MKLVQQFDDLEASREGAGFRETSTVVVRKHLEDIGLDGDIAQYNEISGLSGGVFRLRLASIFTEHVSPIQGKKLSLSSRLVYGTILRYCH